jgi:predicted RNA-binding protein with PIN domain
VRYLIDGYNLMHALGMAPQPGGLTLERARMRFLDWLAVQAAATAGDTCIVFDSKNKRGEAEQVYRDLRVQFSHGQEADDLIEQMIRAETIPARLTVVSNDHRLQHAARRRGCPAWTCSEYIDWLAAPKEKAENELGTAAVEKPPAPSGDEIDEWLKRFGAK